VKLPNYESALIDREKLEKYCLNPEHPEGQHKARVFKSVLDIDLNNLDILIEAFMKGIAQNDAIYTGKNAYGEKYIVDFRMNNQHKYAMVRTAWIIEYSTQLPRLVTCYVL